jgi:hypothetical protein
MKNNKVWVKWIDAAGTSWNYDMVIGLEDNAAVDDLRRSFMAQQKIGGVGPGTLKVFKTEGGDPCKADMDLKYYFIAPSGTAFLPGPGKCRDTALVVEFPQQQQQHPNDPPSATVWNHLNIALPKMPYDKNEIETQGKSTTTCAEFSVTPLSVVEWSDFDDLVVTEGNKEENIKVVRNNIQNVFRRFASNEEGSGIVRVAQEEDVTQNTARIIGAASSMLHAQIIAGNKYCKANVDLTIVEDTTTAEETPTRKRRRVLMSFETKPFWKYEFLRHSKANYFSSEFEVPEVTPPAVESLLPTSWSADKKKVFHLVRQVYGQMRADNFQYGVFHMYEFWWFCKMTQKGELCISRRYDASETGPSVLQGIKTLAGMDEHRIEREFQTHEQSQIKKRKKVGGDSQGGGDNSKKSGKKNGGGKAKSQEKLSDRNAITPPRASDVELWHCTLLDALTGVKILSTRCGSRFVKMVRERRMTRAVAEMEQEAATYEFVQEQDPNCDAVPAFFGMSDHPGVPLILLSMEGPSFEEIGPENLSNELKKSAVESLRCLATMGIWHGDIALRNVVQSKSNQQKAKIVDFGRSSICSDQTLLNGQVDTLERLLTESL